MKPPVYLCLSAYILICCCIIQTETSCPHPDVPANGNYLPKQSEFELGNVIVYSCNDGFVLSGKESRTCTLNGLWSDHSPFCDPAIQLEDATVENKEGLPQLVPRVKDGNSETCFEWLEPEGKEMYMRIAKRIIIHTMKIYLKGSIAFEIGAGLNNSLTLIGSLRSFLETTQEIIMVFINNVVLADTIKVLITENSTLSMCEIEVFGRTEDECDLSPKRSIPNGHLEVSRSEAVLICDESYRIGSSNNRLVCEGNNTWTGGPLICVEDLCNPFVSSEPGVKWTSLDMSPKLPVGARSKMSCSTGYRMVGEPDTIYCQENGWWTKTNATCVEVLCNPFVSSGQTGVEWTFLDMSQKLSVGTRSKISCSTGYQMVGEPDTIFCQENGRWTKTNATCVEVLCNPFVSSRQPGVEWTFLDMSQNVSVGTRSKLTCRTGYQMVGEPDTIFCQKNGRWTKTNATCVEKGDSKQVGSLVSGAVAIAVVLIIIVLLAAIIYFIKKKKKKEVVVLFQPRTDESVISQWERDSTSFHVTKE